LRVAGPPCPRDSARQPTAGAPREPGRREHR